MHDHEVGWGEYGATKFFASLARQWKTLLKKTDAELGIDGAYTRPGIVAFLRKFKEDIENMDIAADEGIKFNCL
jgi:hypothetical protein